MLLSNRRFRCRTKYFSRSPTLWAFACEAFDGHELLGDRSRTVCGTPAHRELYRAHSTSVAACDPLFAASSTSQYYVHAGETLRLLGRNGGPSGLRKADRRHDRARKNKYGKLHVSPPSLQFPLAGPALIVFQPIVISHLALTRGNWLRAGELLASVEIGLWLHLLASSELGSRLQPPVPAGIPAPALFWARASTDRFTYGAYRFSRSRPRENELASEFALRYAISKAPPKWSFREVTEYFAPAKPMFRLAIDYCCISTPSRATNRLSLPARSLVLDGCVGSIAGS